MDKTVTNFENGSKFHDYMTDKPYIKLKLIDLAFQIFIRFFVKSSLNWKVKITSFKFQLKAIFMFREICFSRSGT